MNPEQVTQRLYQVEQQKEKWKQNELIKNEQEKFREQQDLSECRFHPNLNTDYVPDKADNPDPDNPDQNKGWLYANMDPLEQKSYGQYLERMQKGWNMKQEMQKALQL